MNAKKLLPATGTIQDSLTRIRNRILPPFPAKEASILSTNLIKSHFENGRIAEARNLFDEMPDRDVVTWTTMISGYTSCSYYNHAWNMFRNMVESDIEPNAFSVSSVLKTCKGMKDLRLGRSVHSVTVKLGLEGSVYVDNAVMELYAKGGRSMDDACAVFDLMSEKNAVSWTTLIAGYTHRADAYSALDIYRKMLAEGEEPNPYSFSIAVRACASVGSDLSGRQMHGTAIKHGFWFNLPATNSILYMYCRCSCLPEAAKFFDEMDEKDLVSWNTVIAGHEGAESLRLFSQMESRGFPPDSFTFTSVAAACGNLPSFNCGKAVHAAVLRRGLEGNSALNNAFIDMYGKCGSISGSRKIFNAMPQKGLVSWTSMMVGYGSHGFGKEILELFEQMVKSGIEPDRLVFMAVLSGCSHGGLVEDGLKYFEVMQAKYKIEPCREIYGCVVDLLGRAGRVEEAYRLIEKMPFGPDETIWGPLLGACRAHKVHDVGKIVARRVLDSKPSSAGTYLMLSNIYAAGGAWSEFAQVRKMMRGVGGKKEVGRSWIEVGNGVVSFVVGDESVPEVESVYGILKILVWDIRDSGYVPNSNRTNCKRPIPNMSESSKCK